MVRPLVHLRGLTFQLTCIRIEIDVVPCELPLLFSKASMKAAKAKVDFVNDKVNMLGMDLDFYD